MSAIAGILSLQGTPPEPGLIEKVTQAMSRRGPDEQTYWLNDSVALGHCMLRTTAESFEEHQPLISDDGNFALVWDGRLDNREELRTVLQEAGHVLRNNSDAELTLQCYALWGEECPKHLLGDFAFSIWDARNRRFFCARDHVGARPFYYVRSDDFFGFASEEEALLEIPGVSRRPNANFIVTYFETAFNNFDYRRSCLEDVWSLGPASRMTVSVDGSTTTDTYWRPTPSKEGTYRSDEECRAAFLDVFGEAVRCRMRGSGAVAAMMSGGIDSAGIAAMARRLLPEMPGKEFHTYSAISDHQEECVESRCIASLTRGMGDHAKSVSVPSFTGMLSLRDLAEVAWREAHPVDICILLPALMCYAAGREGHRVMLHGASGDLTMYVPDRYPSYLMQAGAWRQAWQECRAASQNHSFLRGASPLSLFLWNIGSAFTPRAVRPLARRLLGKRHGAFRRSAIKPSFARKIHLAERLQSQRASESRSRESDLRQMHAKMLASAWSGLSAGLGAYDRVAGRFGIELRDPWADKRVVEFFLNLPLKYKARHGWTKYLARTAFEKDLDPEVCWRIGKEHLGWQITRALMDSTDDFVSRTLENDLHVLDDQVGVEVVKGLYQRSRNAREPSVIEFIRDTTALVLWKSRLLRHHPDIAPKALETQT